MAANRGNSKLLFIVFGAILTVAIVVMVIILVTRTPCPKEIGFDINPPDDVTINQVVTFNDKSTNPGAKKWEWDFGDGSAHEFNKITSHKYAKPGLYNVVLAVNGNKKCIVLPRRINVKPEEIRVIEQPKLVPVINTPKNVVYVGEPVKFTDATPGATSWEWYFDNGEKILTSKEVIYTFSSPGAKTVQLVVNGNSQTTNFQITVKNKTTPVASGDAPVPHGKKLCPPITESEFKQNLLQVHEGLRDINSFKPQLNNDLSMKILVNGAPEQFNSFCKELMLDLTPRISAVKLSVDPVTGCLTDIQITKN